MTSAWLLLGRWVLSGWGKPAERYAGGVPESADADSTGDGERHHHRDHDHGGRRRPDHPRGHPFPRWREHRVPADRAADQPAEVAPDGDTRDRERQHEV